MIQSKSWIRLDILFLLTSFFILLEQGMELRFGWVSPYKVFFLLMIVQWAALFLQRDKAVARIWKTRASALYKPVRFVLFGICAYILFDLISLLYTQQPKVGILKYVTILTMGALVLWMPVYLRKDGLSERRWKNWLWAVALPGVVLVLTTAVRLLVTGKTFYIFNAALISDYNKSAFLLTTGYLSLQYVFLRYPLRSLKLQIAIHLVSAFTYLSFIWWTGSRRAPMLFYAVALGVTLLVCRMLWRRIENRKNRFLYVGLFALTTLLLLAGAKSTLTLFESRAHKTYARLSALPNPSPKDAQLLEYTKTVSESHAESRQGAMDKRKVLWKIVAEDVKGFTPKEWLIGKGASYHQDIFNQPANRAKITELYGKDLGLNGIDPHNFLLIALLTGGIVKVGLLLFIGGAVLVAMVRHFLREPNTLLFLLLFAAIHLINQALSKHGLIESKDTWFLLMLLIGCIQSGHKSDVAPQTGR